MDRDELLRLLRAFQEESLEYVLIGATALGFHGLIRATEDVDLIVRATAGNLAGLRRALASTYDGDPHIEEIRDEDLLGDYPAVRYFPPSGDLFLDVMTRLGDEVTYESVDAETRQVEGIRVRVATPAALYRMKRNTVRPLDRRTEVPVEKYRSAEEMNAAPIPVVPEEGFERFLRHCARYARISPRRYPRGVFRFRNVEEAQAARARLAASRDEAG